MSRMSHSASRMHRDGFNLIEVVLALSVLSFALVGIISLFPLALNTAKDSKSETRVALIAQTLLAELTATGGNSRIFFSNWPSGPGGELTATDKAVSTTLNLKQSGTGDSHYLTYDSDGNPAGEVNATTYNSGTSDKAYIGTIKAVYSAAPDPLTTVSIQIEWPAAATSANRKKHTFITLLSPDS